MHSSFGLWETTVSLLVSSGGTELCKGWLDNVDEDMQKFKCWFRVQKEGEVPVIAPLVFGG